jgi:GNAT superfamily N-acetyltransferase
MTSARVATPDELADLPAIEAAGDALFTRLGMVLPAETVSVEQLAAAPLVLVTGRPVNGFATVEAMDGDAHLAQLSVLPDHGRRGLGTTLVEAAVAWAERAGYPAVTLTTFADIPWNGPFYARLGFTVIPEDELTPTLRTVRQRQREIGLDDLAPRVAMRRPVGAEVSRPGGGRR